uniref:Stabilin 1 n=1 Tax=Electrophorus electricus TaxID=8005 RepID=A0A4W4EY57_ELEEL
MHYLFFLGLMIPFSLQIVVTRTTQPITVCTSCAAAPAVVCPPGFRKTTVSTKCHYSILIGEHLQIQAGCAHSCEKVITIKKCCSNFWGSLCLPCPSWQGRPCNWHGTCVDGDLGNGTCVCEEGYTGFACQKCLNVKAYGEHCSSVCSCVHGECNSGPDGDGQCYCQPPYSGPKCDKVTASCSNCTAYSYCKGEGQNAMCECLPGFKKVGHICTGICLPNVCDVNAECSYKERGQFQCKCKEGYEGDGELCTPINPCSQNNGGCPSNSTTCEYTGPGKARCVCMSGMEGSNPAAGCRLRSTCTTSTCHRSARCETSQDGIARCLCDLHQIMDGKRCYGNIMERVLELDREGSQSGKLTGSIALFEKNCELILSKHGPFTAFIPVNTSQVRKKGEAICKNHLILGQLLYKDLEGKDLWTYAGEMIRFKTNKQFIAKKDPDSLFTIIESDIPASNGIIHIVDKAFTFASMDTSNNAEFSSKTIGEILTKDDRFSRLLSLVDNCGAPMPLSGPGPLTVFAPSNKAVDRSRDGSLIYMLTDLQCISLFPFICPQGRVLLGEKGIPFESKDIVASNGIIHIIDGILVPPSIIPIMPHRCDVNETVISPCVKCSSISESQCPPGSIEMRAECCRGFYGPDCKPCIGGFQHPCYDNGTCSDGIHGDGTCRCNPGFKGIGCHICSDPNKHGKNCDQDCHCVHGVCDNRPNSLGVCRRGSCHPGYSGELCDQAAALCSSDGAYTHCHIHGYCKYSGDQMTCVCGPGYEGDGYSCTEVNLCLKPERGGCHINAQCVYAGSGNLSCVCNEGWTGDGILCVEVNNCLMEDRGGCHVHAECTPTGPSQNNCECKKGYMGDGLICQIVNPCLEANGGCHSLAACEFKANGTHTCTCPADYEGDGISCYGNILVELDGNSDFYHFNHFVQRYQVITADSKVTALVPSAEAFKNLSNSEETFLFDFYRMPHFLKAHFLDGIYSYDDLKKQVNKMVPTKIRTKWLITNKNGVTFSNETDCCWHVYFVLKPPVSDFPPPPPDLMEVLNKTPSFSLFRQAALLYNFPESIPSKDYTMFVPYDSAVEKYLEKSNSTHLDENIVKYHIIPKEQLFPQHLTDGTLKSTLLGSGYQIMIHVNSNNETLANDVPMDGNFTETKHGVVIGIPRVLEIHKNHCSKDVFLKVLGRCVPCNSPPKCTFSAKPMKDKFPENMKSNCRYRKKVGKKRILVDGCMIDCIKSSQDHSCCPGYFGNDCFKCPGTVDNWCSNNGKCQDGLFGNGTCLCNEGFHGTACEMCEAGRYGKDCKSECHCEHGKCLDGMDGNGQCICDKGWKGVGCSVEIVNDECGGICDENANCITGELGIKPACVCVAGYQGNGTFCKEIDLCVTNNGGCSERATCMKTSPGERSCTCQDDYKGDGIVCLEQDPCLVNNGGCSENAECIKTGPNTAACVCKSGYITRGHICSAINLCLQNNGGCSLNAVCRYTGPGERNCTCHIGYKGDGIECAGTVSRTLLWLDKNRAPDLLRYHIVGCQELYESDLKTVTHVVAGIVYINNNTKIITSDFECSNGVMHFIDKVLLPYEMTNQTAEIKINENLTVTAESYGYSMFSKLLQKTNLMDMVHHTPFHPFTMFWPTDDAFNSLPDEQKNWLYSEDHRDKLAAFMKVHIVRDQRTVACALPSERYVRSMYGSQLTFNCNKNLIGEILINGNDAKIIERHLVFSSGIAYGIDKVLEPPNIGAHCDDFATTEITGRCGTCINTPRCPFGTEKTNQTHLCRMRWDYGYRRHIGFNIHQRSFFEDPYTSHLARIGCSQVCKKKTWISKCCKNHYGRDCQVCPGGLEAPCGGHGDCDDGQYSSGTCKCYPGFTGTACELCEANHYGSNCTACNCTINGKCDDGQDGGGSCFCKEGWTGLSCESKIEIKPVCSPECHSNAVCRSDNQCECEPLYEGDGLSCTASALCSEYNGGCHEQAICTQTGINVTCTCNAGYSGDGFVCSSINRCVEEDNGGCSDFANCIVTGPNERRCECLPGYVGNGVQCLEKVVPPVDRCLEENGGCDANAVCRDLHSTVRLSKTAGVFHLRSPAGKYKMNYTDAEVACSAEGATLATLSQLSDAQQLGMHLCVAGWMDGKRVGYPIRFPSVKCGDNHVGIVLYKDPVDVSSPYDAYCFSMKEVTCECGPGYIGSGEFCNGDLVSVVATNSNFSVFYSTLLNYAEAALEGKTLLNLLSTSSSNITVFVPHDAGFSANETISWRDMEYHISANNSLHFYEDLKHNTTIPSRLGYNLVVALASDNTQADDSPPVKLVNKQIIIDWNVPATNGLIHVIEGPLKAPPIIVMPSTAPHVHLQTSAPAVIIVLIIILIVSVLAGVVHYFLKHKNDAFRFQYFKNEDEDGASTKESGSAAIVSIPNPLYSGYRAFAEPFGATHTPDLLN